MSVVKIRIVRMPVNETAHASDGGCAARPPARRRRARVDDEGRADACARVLAPRGSARARAARRGATISRPPWSARDEQRCGDGLPEHEHSERRPDERREREVGAGPRGPEMTKRGDEQGEAHPVTEEPDDAGCEELRDGRDVGSDRQRQQKVDRPGDEALECRDLNRIGRGELAGSGCRPFPQQTQAAAIRSAPTSSEALPRHDRRTAPAQDCGGAWKKPPNDVLAEHQPSDGSIDLSPDLQGSRAARRSGGVGPREAEHQQERTRHPAGQNYCAEPRQVGPPLRGFGDWKPQRPGVRDERPRDRYLPRDRAGLSIIHGFHRPKKQFVWRANSGGEEDTG